MDLVSFCAIVHTIVIRNKGSVTSWIRSAKHNAAVGGVPNSLHLLGAAVDIVFDDPAGESQAIAEFTAAHIHTYKETDHLHAENRDAPPTVQEDKRPWVS